MPQVYFLEVKKPNNQALKKAAQVIAPLFDGLFQTNDKAALKLHFGEKPSATYIQPAFVEAIYQGLQKKGVSSTLVDCNVLYKSPRSLGSTHLQLAKEQGFNFAPIAILDGEKGEKEMLVPLENTKHFQTAKIGALLNNFNSILALTHFTGHSLTGFGGALKNIGMGLGSKAGKLEMHKAFQLQINQSLCSGCGLCQKECPSEAISLVSNTERPAFGSPKIGRLKAEIDFNKCLGCGQCIALCPQGAVQIPWDSASSAEAQERIAEYAKAALKNKKAFFINLLLNITQRCDCVREKQKPFLKDIGILASSDIVAIDQASLDLAGPQNFTSPNVNPQIQIDHAQRLGLGSKEYELIELS